MTRVQGTLHVAHWVDSKAANPSCREQPEGGTAPDAHVPDDGRPRNPTLPPMTRPQSDMISEGSPIHPSVPGARLPAA